MECDFSLHVYSQVLLLQDRLEGRNFILNQKLKFTHQICLKLKQTYFNQIKSNPLMGFWGFIIVRLIVIVGAVL